MLFIVLPPVNSRFVGEKHRKGFKTLAWPIKHASKSYFLFSSTPFSHPPAWQIKRSEWLVGASTPGWRRWGSPPGAPQLPSTNSLIHGDLLGTPLAARNPLRLIFPFPLARRRRDVPLAGSICGQTSSITHVHPPAQVTPSGFDVSATDNSRTAVYECPR